MGWTARKLHGEERDQVLACLAGRFVPGDVVQIGPDRVVVMSVDTETLVVRGMGRWERLVAWVRWQWVRLRVWWAWR